MASAPFNAASTNSGESVRGQASVKNHQEPGTCLAKVGMDQQEKDEWKGIGCMACTPWEKVPKFVLSQALGGCPNPPSHVREAHGGDQRPMILTLPSDRASCYFATGPEDILKAGGGPKGGWAQPPPPGYLGKTSPFNVKRSCVKCAQDCILNFQLNSTHSDLHSAANFPCRP